MTRGLVMPIVAPSVWAAHFVATYVTVALACGPAGRFGGPEGWPGLVAAYTVIALALISWCLVAGLRRHDWHWPCTPHDHDTAGDRRRFLAFTTMLLAALSLVATVFVAGAALLAGGCG